MAIRDTEGRRFWVELQHTYESHGALAKATMRHYHRGREGAVQCYRHWKGEIQGDSGWAVRSNSMIGRGKKRY